MGHDKDMLARTVSPFELEVEDWANKPPQPARWRRHVTRVTCAAVVIVVACVAAGVTVFLTRRTTPTLSVPEVQCCARLVGCVDRAATPCGPVVAVRDCSARMTRLWCLQTLSGSFTTYVGTAQRAGYTGRLHKWVGPEGRTRVSLVADYTDPETGLHMRATLRLHRGLQRHRQRYPTRVRVVLQQRVVPACG